MANVGGSVDNQKHLLKPGGSCKTIVQYNQAPVCSLKLSMKGGGA